MTALLEDLTTTITTLTVGPFLITTPAFYAAPHTSAGPLPLLPVGVDDPSIYLYCPCRLFLLFNSEPWHKKIHLSPQETSL